MMLVRHGKSATSWHIDQDAPLSEVGIEQARHLARALGKTSDVAVIVSSPLKRCLQTAAPLAQLWNAPVTVDDDFNEIPHPRDCSPDQLHAWLRAMLALPISRYDERTTAWGRKMLLKLANLPPSSIIFTHFFNINFIACSLLQTQNSSPFEIPNGAVLDISPGEGSVSCRIL